MCHGRDMLIMLPHKSLADFQDHRGGGHFSGRLTLGLVAAGVVAKKMLGDDGNQRQAY